MTFAVTGFTAPPAPRATTKWLHFDLSTQTGKKVELNKSVPGGTTVQEFKFSSGRLGYDTPNSPPEGWVMGKKYTKYWSNKYKCWMPWAVNLGIKDQTGADFGAYSHEGRIPKGAYAASHGCIRLSPELAKDIYNWAEEGVTRVYITGNGKDFLLNHFEGRHLLDYNPDGSIKGFKKNPDGTLTKEFIDYARKGKIDVCIVDSQGKTVPYEEGFLAFEFFDKPWLQGVPKAQYEQIEISRIQEIYRKAGLMK